MKAIQTLEKSEVLKITRKSFRDDPSRTELNMTIARFYDGTPITTVKLFDINGDGEKVMLSFTIDNELKNAAYYMPESRDLIEKMLKRENKVYNRQTVYDAVRRAYDQFEQAVDIVNNNLQTDKEEEQTEQEESATETQSEKTTARAEVQTDPAQFFAMFNEMIKNSVKNTLDPEQIKALITKHIEEALKDRKKIITYKIENTKGETQKIEGAHAKFKETLDLVTAGLNVYIWGDSGTGKSYLGEQIAKALNKKFYYTSICSSTPPELLIGYFSELGGKFRQSNFTRAFINGGVLLLDELDNGNTNTTAALNNAIASKQIFIDNGTEEGAKFDMHEDFVLIATGNTIGQGATAQFAGRLPLDGGLKDRFAFIHVDYDEELEKRLAISDELSTEIHRLRARKRSLNIGEAQITTRTIIDCSKLIAMHKWDIDKALKYTLFDKLSPETAKLLKAK